MPKTTSVEPLPLLTPQGFARRPPDPPAMHASINLVEAVNLVARAVTAKIHYHEKEIAALRAALRPFHEVAMASQPATNGLDADDAINQLLSLAGRISNATPERQ